MIKLFVDCHKKEFASAEPVKVDKVLASRKDREIYDASWCQSRLCIFSKKPHHLLHCTPALLELRLSQIG